MTTPEEVGEINRQIREEQERIQKEQEEADRRNQPQPPAHP
jgi:hypothetical protein